MNGVIRVKAIEQYFIEINKYLKEIYEKEEKNINIAADLIAKELEKDKVIHAIGTGCHSQIGVEDLFFRAGGLAPINPIFDFSMGIGALKTTALERIPQYANTMLDYYKVEKDDVLILINAYGINAATVETALECQRRGVHVIGVTSPNNSKAIPKDHPARHPGMLNLCDVPMDVLIDCKMPVGDAVVKIEGVDAKVGPMTTIAISFILQSIVVTTVEKMQERGITPPIITSFNAPDKGINNLKLIEKYFNRIKNF
jgi:uncharacterized phosphosugar-binding protein